MPGARKISPQEWESHKTAISTIYLTENKTLHELIRLMESERGFSATKAQYVRKLKSWCMEKYSTNETWKHAVYLVEKRKLEGKDTMILDKQGPVPAKRLKKELSRLSNMRSSIMAQADALTVSQTAITALTPPTEMLCNRELPMIPWFQFQDLIELFKVELDAIAPLDSLGPSSFLASNAVPSMPNFNTFSFDGSFEPHSYSPVSHTSTNWPSQEFHQDLHWGSIEPSFCDGGFPDWGQSFTTTTTQELMDPAQVQRTNREVRVLLGDCLSETTNPDSSEEYVSKITSRLGEIALERNDGDLVRQVQAMFSSSPLEAMLQVMRYTIYLSSNKLLSASKTDSILQSVIKSERFSAIELLLKRNLPTMRAFASNLLVSAARLGERAVCVALLRANANPNTSAPSLSRCGLYDTGLMTTALHEAIKNDDDTLVQLLLEAGASPDVGDNEILYLDTPLRIALSQRHKSIALMLIEHGADVNNLHNLEDPTWPLLVDAVELGDLELVRKMLNAGARVNEESYVSTGSLRVAVINGDVEILQLLLDAGADVNAPSGEKYELACETAALEENYWFFRTPLLEAVWKGYLNIIRILLDAGADVNGHPARDYVDFLDYNVEEKNQACCWVDDPDDLRQLVTPLHGAIHEGNIGLTRLLIDRGGDLHIMAGQGNALQIAAAKESFPDKMEIIQLLLGKGSNLNSPARAPESATALQAAAGLGDENLVQFLLMAGANVNAPPNHDGGRTALQAAVESGNLNLVKRLADAGGDVNAPPAFMNGRTCMQAAAYEGETSVIDLLISLGADIDDRKVSGPMNETPLTVAAKNWQWRMVQTLLNKGAKISECPYGRASGASTLCCAANAGNLDVVRSLLHSGVDPNARDELGTPLGRALRSCTENAPEIVSYLVQAGADVNKTSDSLTPLQIAVGQTLLGRTARNKNSCIKILVDAGAKLQGPIKGAAFTEIVENNEISVVRMLLSNGMRLNQDFPMHWGYRSDPLTLAVRRNSTEMIELLLYHGLDPNADDGQPLREAVESHSKNIVRLLIQAGANVNAPAKRARQRTALQGAVRSNNTDLVKILLDAGALINVPPAPEWGETALQAAVDIGSIQMVQFLLTHGADVNGPPSPQCGATALQRAAIVGHLRIASDLINHGANVNAAGAGFEGRTALEAAAEHGRLDIACLLLRNDGDLETLKTRCKQAAQLARSSRNCTLAEVLEEWGDKYGVDDF